MNSCVCSMNAFRWLTSLSKLEARPPLVPWIYWTSFPRPSIRERRYTWAAGMTSTTLWRFLRNTGKLRESLGIRKNVLRISMLNNFSLNAAVAQTYTRDLLCNSLLLCAILNTMHWLVHIVVTAVFRDVIKGLIYSVFGCMQIQESHGI